MGYNRDTQWTKYWIMDIIDEARPSLSVMSDVIRFLQVNKEEMFARAEEDFSGATALMEWLVQSYSLPLRKAKMIVERAVKYSEFEKEDKVSLSALNKALMELKVNIKIDEKQVEEIQRPERILKVASPLGTPSQKRMKEAFQSFRHLLEINKELLKRKKRQIEIAKRFILKKKKALVD
jgi:argininosuccinate lyase